MKSIKDILKKKYKLIAILFIIFLMIIIILLNLNNKDTKDNKPKKTYTDKIVEKIEAGKIKNIYLINTENCEFCISSDNYLRYYQKLFGFKYFTYDLGKFSKKESKKLLDATGFPRKDLSLPAFIIIRDRDKGNVLINEVDVEKRLQVYLEENNLIDKKLMETELYIDDVEFESMIDNNERFLMFIRNEEYKEYETRETIYNLAIKYNFKYYTSVYMYKNGVSASVFLNNLVPNHKMPILYLVENKRITDYTSSNNQEKIEKFLKKHKFIK
ncbi:MAG: hypothetical protein VZS44_07230 [Bacilli bacterium]|nr:hypothetical protein [Bacilli bacterium]